MGKKEFLGSFKKIVDSFCHGSPKYGKFFLGLKAVVGCREVS